MNRFPLWLTLSLLLFASRAAAVDVVVTIKPLHSIAASVMSGVGEPVLLLDGTVSPHIDRIKPSMLKKLRSADLLIWIGPGLESFLSTAVDELPASVTALTASEQALPLSLNLRDGHAGDKTGYIDPHLWLDPKNAAALADVIAARLGEIDPANAARYQHNAGLLAKQMEGLTISSKELLAQAGAVPFIVFHDFTQYLEERFTLNNAGVVTYQPRVVASARHLRELNRVISELNIACVLTEPQFEDRALRSLSDSSGFRYVVVDPLASRYESGPSLYGKWFTELVATVNECLLGH